MNKNNFYVIGALLLVGFMLYGGQKLTEFISDPPQPKEEWQQNYRMALLENKIPLEYTQAQSTIDYTTEDLQKVINEMNPTSPEDAVKKATSFVSRNIRYSFDVTQQYCYAETATSVFRTKQGDCVSMTKLGTAILRGQGIAVKTVGGCLVSSSCSAIMGSLPLYVKKPDIWDGKKRGIGLHEWAEVWLPNKGWVTVDFTNGGIYQNCPDYMIYGYDNAHYKEVCVIEDWNFIEQCKEA